MEKSNAKSAMENLARTARRNTITSFKESKLAKILNLTHEWLRHYASITQIHGIKWYNIAPNRLFRSFFVVFFICWVITLPVYFTNEGFNIYYSPSLSTAIEWKRDENLTYPNLTVCFPKFFDNTRLEARNISNNLANYMTMVLDPNVGQLVEYMKREFPTYGGQLDLLQAELQWKLASENISIVELFQSVAIQCESFITLCEVHRKFLLSSKEYPTEKQCCGVFFNPTPFFSNAGTCFTSYAQVYEKSPFTFSNIRVWLNLQNKRSPSIDLRFKGSDALERRGIYFAISGQDHPVTKLMHFPYKAPKGVSVLIGLRTKQIDRNGLTSNVYCRNEVQSFENQYKVTYTKLNCEFFANSGFQHNCSLAPFYGINIENGTRPCIPSDFVDSSDRHTNIFDKKDGQYNVVCLPSCLISDFELKVTEGLIDTKIAEKYEAVVGKKYHLGSLEDLTTLQLYFNSFDYEAHTLYKPTLVDLLSKIGGWLGIINGSSIVSVAELFILFSIFVFKVCTGRAG